MTSAWAGNAAFHPTDDAHQLIHSVGDKFGYGWIVALALIGAIWFFRKRIKGFFE